MIVERKQAGTKHCVTIKLYNPFSFVQRGCSEMMWIGIMKSITSPLLKVLKSCFGILHFFFSYVQVRNYLIYIPVVIMFVLLFCWIQLFRIMLDKKLSRRTVLRATLTFRIKVRETNTQIIEESQERLRHGSDIISNRTDSLQYQEETIKLKNLYC